MYYKNKILNNKKEYLLSKYNNIKYGEYKFSLAKFLWNYFVVQKDFYFEHDLNLDEQYLLVECLIPYLDNLEKYFMDCVFICSNLFNKKKIQIDYYKLTDQIFKNIKNPLSKINMSTLFCRGDIYFIKNMSLQVDDLLLQNALSYGRIEIIKYLDEIDILKNHENPFSLDKIDKYYSVKDIWRNHSWGNDEWERPLVGNSDYKECFNFLIKYFELKDEYLSKWLCICNAKNYGYSPEFDDIISFFFNKDILNIDNINKEIILDFKNKFGNKVLWLILKKINNEKILDYLL